MSHDTAIYIWSTWWTIQIQQSNLMNPTHIAWQNCQSLSFSPMLHWYQYDYNTLQSISNFPLTCKRDCPWNSSRTPKHQREVAPVISNRSSSRVIPTYRKIRSSINSSQIRTQHMIKCQDTNSISWFKKILHQHISPIVLFYTILTLHSCWFVKLDFSQS
jgi:hypothetical protein